MQATLPSLIALAALGFSIRWIVLGRRVGFGPNHEADPAKAQIIRKVCIEFLTLAILVFGLAFAGYL